MANKKQVKLLIEVISLSNWPQKLSEADSKSYQHNLFIRQSCLYYNPRLGRILSNKALAVYHMNELEVCFKGGLWLRLGSNYDTKVHDCWKQHLMILRTQQTADNIHLRVGDLLKNSFNEQSNYWSGEETVGGKKVKLTKTEN